MTAVRGNRRPLVDSLERPPEVAGISLDATGVLFSCPNLGEVYAEVLARHGLRLDPDWVQANFRTTLREMDCRTPLGGDRFSAHPEGARGWWSDLVCRLCALAGAAEPSRFALVELYERFRRADVWRVDAGVRRALFELSEHLPLVVTSNWDERLHDVLRALDLRRYFRGVVISAELGIGKPHPQIFLESCRVLDCEPAEVVHVGDSELEDHEGAIGAGLRSLWIDDRDPGRCLAELATVLVPGVKREL